MDDSIRYLMRTARRAAVALVVVGTLGGLTACSRKEPPKAPAKAAGTVPAVAVTPTNTAQATVPQSAEPVAEAAGKLPVSRREYPFGPPPKRVAGSPERRAALRATQKEIALKGINSVLAQKGRERTAAEVSVVKSELAVRESDPAVHSAYEAWEQARSAYKSACEIGIDGYADLTRQATELRASVDREVAAAENGGVTDTNAIAHVLQRLDGVTRSVSELERKAIYEEPQTEVQQANEAVAAAYAAYRKALSANAAYRGELQKRAAVQSEYMNLSTRLGEVSSEN